LIAQYRSAVRALRRDLLFLFTSAALNPLQRHRAFAASQPSARIFATRRDVGDLYEGSASAPSGAPAIVVF
jgi:hypothetical protein